MEVSSELAIFRSRLVEANEAMIEALASGEQPKIRDTLQRLSSSLNFYVGHAIKEADQHEGRHIIDALQAAINAILPETRPVHVHGSGRPPRRADIKGHG